MRINELVQTGTKTITEQMPVLDEEGNKTGEFQTVTREVPVMEVVYRDMTTEEEAEAVEQQAAADEYERTRPRTEMELLAAGITENATDTAVLMDAVAELSVLVSDMMEVQNG